MKCAIGSRIQKFVRVIFSCFQVFPNKTKFSVAKKRIRFMREAGICARCLMHITLIAWMSSFLFCSTARAETGIASYYGAGEKLNRQTANGDVFYPTHLTAASYRWNLGTYVRCTSEQTKKSIVVLINDRGPSKRLGRLIDLSHAAFRLIDNPQKGTVKVTCDEVRQ